MLSFRLSDRHCGVFHTTTSATADPENHSTRNVSAAAILSTTVRHFASSTALSLAPKKKPSGASKVPPAPIVPPSASKIKATVMQQQQQQLLDAKKSTAEGGGGFSETDLDDIFDDGNLPQSSIIGGGSSSASSQQQQLRSAPPQPPSVAPTVAGGGKGQAPPPPPLPRSNKWGAVSGIFDSVEDVGPSGNLASDFVGRGASASTPAVEKHWACDICANINFENEVQLDAHMQTKHAGLCGNYRELRDVSENKLRPNWSALLEASTERWRRWGEKTFHVASQRDGGREKIREAHAARAQLEVIVQRWNPEARVFVFGSSVVMGVWDGMSDIDYMVANVNDMEKGCWPPNEKNAVRALTDLLKRAGFKYSNLEPIQHARVPIIKHHAAVPLYNAIPKEAEDVVSRTVRWVFTQPLSTQDRIHFEAGLREAVGELNVSIDDDGEDINVNTVVGEEREQLLGANNGGAISDSSNATSSGASGAIAGDDDATNSTSNAKASNTATAITSNNSNKNNNNKKKSYQSPIVQLWWHSEHISCSATFVTTTHAVKAIVHTPCVPANLLRRVGPLHDDFQPELFKIDFDLGFRPFGVRNSFLLRNYLNSHPCARPGAVVLKDWSKSSGINNSIGGYYTSYAVNIMWIYFLVQKGIIPYIDPQSIPQSLVGCRDFNPSYVPIFPPEIEVDEAKRAAMFQQMGELLVGFFAFYCLEFDWEKTVITLNRSGEPTLKEDLQWNDTAVVQGKKSTRYLQCIEDPYEDNLNLGRHVGDGRRWKVMQEFYRALVSLLKDPFNASCVFSVTDQTSAASSAPSAATTVQSTDGEPSLPSAEPTESKCTTTTGDATAAALHPPTTEDMLFLTGLSVKFIESSPQGHVSEAELKTYIRSESSGRGAVALDRALAAWRWDIFVRKIGYKHLGGRVYARRIVGAKAAKSIISEEQFVNKQKAAATSPSSSSSATTATTQAQAGRNNSTSTGDLSEQLVKRSIQSSLDRPANAPPEWVLWTPPSYALPTAANNNTGHVPGHREPTANHHHHPEHIHYSNSGASLTLLRSSAARNPAYGIHFTEQRRTLSFWAGAGATPSSICNMRNPTATNLSTVSLSLAILRRVMRR